MELVDRILFSAWIAFAIPAVLLLACAELGLRLGLRAYSTHDETSRSTIGGVQGAILGLLGLLLGFTFAMGAARYETRRELVVKEANAIGTTYLRASLLPAAHVGPVQDLLRRYVALRLDYYSILDDPAVLADTLARSADLQRQLWEHAVTSAREGPSVMVAAFVNALNETIDTEAERVAAGRAQIPPTAWALLLIVAAFGCLTSAFASGSQGGRSAFSTFVLPLLIAVVFTLIFDITHSQKGFISVSQQSLVDLQKSIAPRGD